MVETMTIALRMLTPLWTGGVDGTTDRIHETGIIGSLRWWYEAIVRGLGGNACDPTATKCEYNLKKPNNGLCDVCQVFGATGWKRRFRVEVVDDKTTPAWEPPPNVLNIRPPDRNRGWYLPPGQMGQFMLQITGEERVLNLMAALILFLERRGNLGAKPQLGYGVFAVDDEDRANVEERANKWQWKVMGPRPPDEDTPDLRRFGFFCYRFQPEKPGWWTQVPGMERVAVQAQPVVSTHKTVPIAPALKNAWRFQRWQRVWGDERKFFGMSRPDRMRSKVAVSWAYKKEDAWEMSGHVWLQENIRQPEAVWAMLGDVEVWRETIGVPGKIETYPAGPWRPWLTTDVARFLETTR
jgi:CRISPR-associated protein Cmr1